jgi:putative Holliday junction resolvase
MRYLGIDYGSKRVGFALSDEAGTMGFPHAVLPNTGLLIDQVQDIIKHKDVEVVVIGKSIGMSGEENPIAQKAKDFAQLLERTTDVRVEWELEMYTTQEARRDPEGVHVNSREAVDAAAAAILLTSYLSRINPSKEYDYDTED